MADWLKTEMAAATRNVRQPHINRLLALGVAGSGLADLGRSYPAFGVDRIQRRSGGMYESAEEGASALIVLVCWPEHHEGLFGEIITVWPVIDMIAISTDNPAAWLWRTGTAWALGGHLLEDWQGEPVEMVATPLQWLSSGGAAVCIREWKKSGALVIEKRNDSKGKDRPCIAVGNPVAPDEMTSLHLESQGGESGESGGV